MSVSLALIKERLASADIEGFIELGAPSDEYDSEAALIAEKLASLAGSNVTEQSVLDIIVRIWADSFELNDDDMQKRVPAINSLAAKIFSDLLNER